MPESDNTESTPSASSPEHESDEIGYADALAELEQILDELEDESIDIDVLSERVERASDLIGICRGRIATAHARVSQVVDELEGGPVPPADQPGRE